MDSDLSHRGQTWTNLDSGNRVVEWVASGSEGRWPRPSRFENQRWAPTEASWIATDSVDDWNEASWWLANGHLGRGPLPTFVPEGAFSFLGSVTAQRGHSVGGENDEGPDQWSAGRFSLQHQCAGYGMAQALLDGAFFPIAGDDTSPLAVGLRSLSGPYSLIELDDVGADGVAATAGALLSATALPSNFERPCGEALHLFRISDALVWRIARAFKMAITISSDGGAHIEASGPAPFSTVADLAGWRGLDPDRLVAAFGYENCD